MGSWMGGLVSIDAHHAGPLRLVDGGRVSLPGPRILSERLWVSVGVNIRKPASDTSRRSPSDR